MSQDVEVAAKQSGVDESLLRPSLTFKTITFSDQQTFEFAPDEIVVLVGPNNAGKSAALKELQNWINRSVPGSVTKNVTFDKVGSSEDLRIYLEKNSQIIGPSSDLRYTGIGYSIHYSHLNWFENATDRHPVGPFFSGRLATESRIVGADPAGPIALFTDAPTHPIHLLLMDDVLAKRVGALFRRAFGKDLMVFRAGGSSFPLYVGDLSGLEFQSDQFSREYINNFLSSAVPLNSQGDGMRSFATVLIHALAPENHSVQFLDEPEAFLHPPQARLLGEFIARERSGKSQLFIATHSTDILEGLLAGGGEKVRIFRIQRNENINRVKELSKVKTKSILTDTLTRYSGLFEGIFYKNVFLAESDSDCLFYNSILNIESVSGVRQPDVLFVHAAGKHRLAKMAETLRMLDVSVCIIADIDLISSENDLKPAYEALGGDWGDIEGHHSAVKNAVEALRPPFSADEVRKQIQDKISAVGGSDPFPRSVERDIKYIFKNVSPWSAVKQSGRAAIRGAQAIQHFDQLIEKCSKHGLWIVPVGELEGFCRSVEGSHGPGFVQKVLEERDLEADPELQEARDFVRRIWSAADQT